MKKALAIVLFFLMFTVSGVAAGTGPDIRIVDNKVSIQADAVPLSRFLHLWDQATGMTSKVPPELANRNVSIQVTGLSLDEAVRKIFEGQPLDYVFVQGKGIVVTGTSQTLNAKNSPAPSTPPSAEPMVEQNPMFPQPGQQPNQAIFPGSTVAGVPGAVNGAQNQNQPATIQTPFGTMPNPRATQTPNAAAPMATPGQTASQNPFNSSLPGFNSTNQLPGLQSNPAFGSTPAQPNNPFNNSPFNNTTPSSYPNTVPNNGFPGTTPTQPRPNP